MNASIADQRSLLTLLYEMETTGEDAIREHELIQKAIGINSPVDCIHALIASKHIRRIETASGRFIKRVEK